MTSKFEMAMNCNINFTGICQNQLWLTDKEYLRDHRCEGRNMAYKCKIFEWETSIHIKYLSLSLKPLWAIVICMYTCVYNFKRYWHK